MAIWNRGFIRPYVMGVMATAAIGTGLVAAQVKQVHISVQSPQGKRDLKLWTFRNTVRNILAEAKVTVHAHDKLSQALAGTFHGTHLTIRRAMPVMVTTAQHHLRAWTTDYRVSHILSALSIKLGPLDLVHPALTASVAPGHNRITVIRRRQVKKTVRQPISFGVQYRPDPHLVRGHSTILQAGKTGIKQIIERVTLQNGKAVHSQTVKASTLQPPAPEVVGVGTLVPLANLTSRGGGPQFTRAISVVATGYWPSPTWSTGITATGTRAHYGVVAVDPRVIPLGTHLYIPGYGFGVAEDTGSAIVGDRIDLCFNNGSQAINWGVRQVTVYIQQP